MKNRSKKGSSIIIAIMVFMICSLGAMTAVLASSSASGRLSGLKQRTRAQFTVRGISELIAGQICGKSIREGYSAEGRAFVFEGDSPEVFKMDILELAGENGGTRDFSFEAGNIQADIVMTMENYDLDLSISAGTGSEGSAVMLHIPALREDDVITWSDAEITGTVPGEHDTVTPVFCAVTVSASDRTESDIKLRFIEE